MQLNGLPDLISSDPAADHGVVFNAHNRKRTQLITRWRGTVIEQSSSRTIITAWQKSIYHFGGIDREVPIVVRLELEPDGKICEVFIDERSRGSQGKRCDFAALEKLAGSLLKGTDITRLHKAVNTAGDVKCLHLYEILAGAASFYDSLPSDRKSGTEQELLTITPFSSGLIAENVHDICGRRDRMVLDLKHNIPPVMNDKKLCSGADAVVTVRFNDEECGTENVSGESFELVFASLNRLFTRCQLLEKNFFGQKGRIRFSNYPSMVGLFLLSFSHSAMRGGPQKALQIEGILHYLQTGYHPQPCKGFGG